MSDEDMTVILNYCTTKLSLLRRDLTMYICDTVEANEILKEITYVRQAMVICIQRYDDYASRLATLVLPLPDGVWLVGDALCGADHAYVLCKIEYVSMKHLVHDRLACKDSAILDSAAPAKEIELDDRLMSIY